MRTTLFPPFEMLALALAASAGVGASRIGFLPIATQTQAPEDGANAALQRPSPTPTASPDAGARFGAMELLRARDEYTMGQNTCGFGLNQSGLHPPDSINSRRAVSRGFLLTENI